MSPCLGAGRRYSSHNALESLELDLGLHLLSEVDAESGVDRGIEGVEGSHNNITDVEGPS
jgi:hypothetical protein